MAFETRNRAHAGDLTLHDFGVLLKDGHLRMPKGGADRFVVRFVNAWVKRAKRKPRNPRAFTPLFLQAMIKRQVPSIDISKPFRPRDVRLTNLEWMLLGTALGRGAKPARRVATVTAPRVVIASGPCSDIQKVLNSEIPIISTDGKSVTQPGDLFQEALKQVLKKRFGESGQKDVSTVLKLLKIVQKYHALALFFRSATIRVFPQEGDSVHRPIQNTKKVFHFSAIGGLNDQAQKEYADAWIKQSSIYQGVKDCAQASGIPIPDTAVDIAKDLDKWRVLWTQLGSSQNAVIDQAESHFDAGVHKHKLKRISETEGAAVMAIDIIPESLNDHEHGVAAKQSFAMRADLLASQPPDVSKLKGMIESLLKQDMQGFGISIAGIITDLVTNWAKAAATPNAQGSVTITEHLPCNGPTLQLIRLQVIKVLSNTCQDNDLYYRVVAASGNDRADGTLTTASCVINATLAGPWTFAFTRTTGAPDGQLHVNQFGLSGSVIATGTSTTTAQTISCNGSSTTLPSKTFTGAVGPLLTFDPVAGRSDLVDVTWFELFPPLILGTVEVQGPDCRPNEASPGSGFHDTVPLSTLQRTTPFTLAHNTSFTVDGGPATLRSQCTGTYHASLTLQRVNANGSPLQ